MAEEQNKPNVKFFFEEQSFSDRKVYQEYLPKAVCSRSFKSNKLDLVGYYVRCNNPDNGQVELIYFLPKIFSIDGKVFGKDIKDSEPLEYDDIVKDENTKNVLDILPALLGKALSYYRSRKEKSDIVREVEQDILRPSDSEHEASLTETIYALEDFYLKNKDLVLFIYQQSHTGYHKVNWSKTIRKKDPMFVDHGGKKVPIYMETVTKRKTVDYDEELMVLFFDTLQYIVDRYSYPLSFESIYELTPPEEFNDMVENELIIPRMEEIKNNYFSDQLTELWRLLYTFHVKNANVTHGREEDYMLVNAFHAVFEDMVDSLISDTDLLTSKHQVDDKRIDHLFLGKSLFDDSKIYYIADSKYYSEDNAVGGTSVGKQFTYVNNILQDAIDAYNNDDKAWEDREVYYYDQKTEGYNVTPNFFIRGKLPELTELSFDDDKLKPDMNDNNFYDERCHHRNRLFDRDTLFLLNYSINFLFLLKYYNDYNAAERTNLQRKLEEQVSNDMKSRLEKKYEFKKIEEEGFINYILKKSFRALWGKSMLFNKDGKRILILAHVKDDKDTAFNQIFNLSVAKKVDFL